MGTSVSTLIQQAAEDGELRCGAWGAGSASAPERAGMPGVLLCDLLLALGGPIS